jgi:hypothetical protein
MVITGSAVDGSQGRGARAGRGGFGVP